LHHPRQARHRPWPDPWLRPICPVCLGQGESYAPAQPAVKSTEVVIRHIRTTAGTGGATAPHRRDSRDTVGGMPPAMPARHILADDALLSLLLPFWQLVIGICVLLVLVVSAHRLIMRGASRMTTALLVTGAAVLGSAALGILLR